MDLSLTRRHLTRALLFMALLSATATLGWSDACIAAGTRTGGGPSNVPGTPNPTYIPSGQPGFGESGPTNDQDDPDFGGENDVCMTLNFWVPPPAPGKDYPGWGGLVLTFDRPIDGGSFVFDPICSTPADGLVGELNQTTDNPGNMKSIRFVAKTVKGTAYQVQSTGTDTGQPAGSQAAKFSLFAVTIMYDDVGGVPVLQIGNGSNPMSFFQGKPGKQGFASWELKAGGPGTPGVNYALAFATPEPSFLLPLLFILGFLAFRWQKRQRSV